MNFSLNPRRILMTADAVGGVWTYVLDLARALREKKIEIALAVMGIPLSPDQRRQAARLGNVRLFESGYKLEWMENPWQDVQKAGYWLLDIEQDFAPDLIHLNGFVHGSLGWSAPVLIVGHSCVLSWWHAVRGEPVIAGLEKYREAVTAGLRSADMVIAPTAAMLSRLVALYGPFLRQGVVYNGRELPARAFDITKEHFIFTAGRIWDEAKNIGVLESIAGDLAWPVYSAGNATAPGMKNRIRLKNILPLGTLDRNGMVRWYRRASIYALPALYEPFGLTVLEAAQCGCALVLGDIPSLRELWEGAAVFVPPDSPRDLRNALTGLINSKDERARLSASALSRALNYSLERMRDGYLEVYRNISDQSPTRNGPDRNALRRFNQPVAHRS